MSFQVSKTRHNSKTNHKGIAGCTAGEHVNEVYMHTLPYTSLAHAHWGIIVSVQVNTRATHNKE